MTDNIFLDTAPAYYARNISVIPLKHHEKRPIPFGWSAFHDKAVDQQQAEEWLRLHPHANIGVVLGEQSGIAVMDIDDDDIVEAMKKILPPSPWERIGAKGMVIAYKYTSNVPTFRIKKEGNHTLIEYLSSGTQVVLPPSIHPDTQAPYTANCDLLDVIDSLPTLPNDIEDRLREELGKDYVLSSSSTGNFNTAEYQSLGARDTAATRYAGLLCYQILRGEITFLEAQRLMKTWGEHQVANASGDPLDIDKAMTNITRFLVREVSEKNKVLPIGWDSGLDEAQKIALGLTFEDEHEEWDLKQIQAYLASVFEANGANTIERSASVDFILKKVAKSTNLNILDSAAVIKFIKSLDDSGVSIADYKNRVKELQKGPLEGSDHAEIADAVIDEIQHKDGDLRYEHGQFWCWNGDHWKEYHSQKILSRIAKEFGHLPAAKKRGDHTGIEKVMRDVLPQQLVDTGENGVNFANGFVTEDGSLYTHDPKYGMTYVLPYRYMPSEAGKFPMFEKLLYDSWGHSNDFQDKVSALQEAMCITIFGRAPSYERCFLLYGLPSSGKSQILGIISQLVPKSAKTSLPPTKWKEQFAPAMLRSALVNIAGELSEYTPIDGALFKQITSGEETYAENKRKDPFIFRPKCAHWFASNYLPRTRDTSEGFTRRWLVFNFDKQIDPDKKIIDLWVKIVAEEIEAIVSWAVLAMPRLIRNNEYTLPESHHEKLEEMSAQNSTVKRFFREKISLIEGEIDQTDLYKKYITWCLSESGTRPVTKLTFTMEFKTLGQLGGRFETKGGKYVGIAIKN